jgi:hypothetical protein
MFLYREFVALGTSGAAAAEALAVARREIVSCDPGSALFKMWQREAKLSEKKVPARVR